MKISGMKLFRYRILHQKRHIIKNGWFASPTLIKNGSIMTDFYILTELYPHTLGMQGIKRAEIFKDFYLRILQR